MTTLPADWFQLVVVVYGLNQGEGFEIYINGVLSRQASALQGTGYTANDLTQIQLGGINVEMDADNLAIWLAELTSAQITSLYSM